MSITVNSIPESYPSMHDDLWFVVSSTNVSNTNFKYVFDVYVNSSLVARIKTFADPSTGKGIFNASNIIRNYIASYFKPNSTQTAFAYTGNDIYVSYQIQYGEEYAGTTYLNLASATYTAFNFYNPIFRDPSASYFSSYVSQWLTSRDKSSMETMIGEKMYVGWMNATGVTTSLTLTIQQYNENGSTNGTAATGSAVTASTFVLFDLSPGAINAYLGTSFITSSTYSYGVKVDYASTHSEELRIRLACNKHTPVSIYFLNQLGGIDSMVFRMVNKESRNIEKKSYEQINWQLNSGTNTMQQYDGYKRMYAGSNVFSVSHTVSFKLISDYLSITDYNWIKDIIGSPEVYMEKSGYYYPITIKTSTWEEKNRITDKMFNIELDVECSRKINSQFR